MKALVHYLSKLEKDTIRPTFFSDACSQKNKNFIVLCCLKNFVEANVIFKSVKHFFPIRGLSFLPPD